MTSLLWGAIAGGFAWWLAEQIEDFKKRRMQKSLKPLAILAFACVECGYVYGSAENLRSIFRIEMPTYPEPDRLITFCPLCLAELPFEVEL